jgi:hypothetical protein
LGRISQAVAQLLDRHVQAPIEVDEGAVRPKRGSQLLARYQFARSLEEGRQYQEGLPFNLDLPSGLEQLPGRKIYLEGAEADRMRVGAR